MLGPKRADALEIEGRKGESEEDGHLHPPKDSEEPPGQVDEGTLSAAFTDSTTWRLPMEIRHAVLP